MTCQAFTIIYQQIRTLSSEHRAKVGMEIESLKKARDEIAAMLARDTATASTARTRDSV